jgi:hypothetical protein
MAAQTPVWVGFQGIKETPDSPKITADATRFTVERTFEGPLAACNAQKPTQNQAFADMPAGCLVVNVQVLPMPGGRGRIIVRGETLGPSQTTPFSPLYEREWRPVERKIELHPRYADGTGGTTAGPKTLTVADRVALQAWEAEDDFKLRSAFKYKVAQTSPTTTPPQGYTPSAADATTRDGIPYDVFVLSDNAKDLAGKKLKGTDSYRVFYPVVRTTTQRSSLPDGNPCNVIGDPPSEANPPSGFTWITSADRATKTGRYGMWEEQGEWEGNDSIDTDLYPPPA